MLTLLPPLLRRAEAEGMARKLGIKLYRSCVKENLNVDPIFTFLAQQYVERGMHVGAKPVDSIGAEIAPPLPRRSTRNS